jgi:hypothetical protein
MALFDAILNLADILGVTDAGIASAAGATTLTCASVAYPNDWFNDGTMFITTGTAASKSAIISDSTSAGVFTFATMSPAPAAAAHFVVARPLYTRAELVRAVNVALQQLGPLVDDDETLTAVTDQEEYDLPTGVSRVLRVEVATSLTAPYNYQENQYWKEIEGHLRFKPALTTTSMKIRLYYEYDHPRVEADADSILGNLETSLVAYKAAFWALDNRIVKGDVNGEKMLKIILTRLEEFEAKRPIKMKKSIPLAGW